MSDMRTSSVVPVSLLLFQGLGTIVDVARKVIRLGNTREDVLSCSRGPSADRLDAKQSLRSAVAIIFILVSTRVGIARKEGEGQE